MKSLLFFLFVLFAMSGYSQQGKPSNLVKASSQTKYGTFENYAFVLNGKVIEQKALSNYPGATLSEISPVDIRLEGNTYRGVIYFNTPGNPVIPAPYASDPAYFINGKQVSPFDIHSSRPEVYRQISKSVHDTVINGTHYKGTIQVDTDEDFFAGRIALSKVLGSFADLPQERLIVYWYSPKPVFSTESAVGMLIPGHFSIYHLDTSDLKTVNIDRIRFADGERYVVHLIDERYNRNSLRKWWPGSKSRAIFKDPLSIDTTCPCGSVDFDATGISKQVGRDVEIMTEPYQGEEVYLKKLSNTMGLPIERSKESMLLDSITVRFIVTRDGMFTILESSGPNKPGHASILAAINQHSCTWSLGIISGQPVRTQRKMTIFYSKDKNGSICSLDSMAYRYDK